MTKARTSTQVVFFIGADIKRDQLTITTPRPLTKKQLDALQAAVTKATWHVLTARPRRKAKR